MLSNNFELSGHQARHEKECLKEDVPPVSLHPHRPGRHPQTWCTRMMQLSSTLGLRFARCISIGYRQSSVRQQWEAELLGGRSRLDQAHRSVTVRYRSSISRPAAHRMTWQSLLPPCFKRTASSLPRSPEMAGPTLANSPGGPWRWGRGQWQS